MLDFNVYVYFVYMYVCVPCLYLTFLYDKEGIYCPGNGITDRLESLYGC